MSGMNSGVGRLLTLRAAAELLGVSVWSLRRWSAQRRFAVVKLGRRVLVEEAEIRALVARNTLRAKAPPELRM